MQNSLWPSWSENKLFTVLVSLLLISLIGFVSFGIAFKVKSFDYIGVSPEKPNTIQVTGIGKVVAVPDIAKVTLGTEATEKDVATAQNKVTKDINKLIEELKDEFDIDEKDIKTVNYNIHQDYDWDDGTRVLRGYRVSQNVEVKIRETDTAGQVVALAGEIGLKTVSGLQFTIDDPEEYRQEAREIAMGNAKEKAEELADIAGVKLGKIVSFSEGQAAPEPMYSRAAFDEAVGFGGEMEVPEIEVGSQEIQVIATVEYEIL